jgi:hypothetical protein
LNYQGIINNRNHEAIRRPGILTMELLGGKLTKSFLEWGGSRGKEKSKKEK